MSVPIATVVGAETLLDMIDVVQHHVDIAVAAQKARYATNIRYSRRYRPARG